MTQKTTNNKINETKKRKKKSKETVTNGRRPMDDEALNPGHKQEIKVIPRGTSERRRGRGEAINRI